MDRFQKRVLRREPVEQRAGPVDRTVVDDDDLVAAGELREQPLHRVDDLADRPDVVVGGEEGRDRGTFGSPTGGAIGFYHDRKSSGIFSILDLIGKSTRPLRIP